MKSIRDQLRRALLQVLVGLLFVGLILVDVVVWQILVRAFDNSLRSQAEAVVALTEIEGGRLGSDFSEDFLKAYTPPHAHHFFQLRDSSGKIVSSSPSLASFELPAPQSNHSHQRPVFWNLQLPSGHSGRAIAYGFVPVINDATPFAPSLHNLTVVVADDSARLNETLIALFLGTGAFGLLLTSAIWFVVPRVLQKELQPLDNLGNATARITADSLTTRFAADALPLELRPIAQRLNDLLGRLESSFERERRFSADLAHELRTPLAELRSIAESVIKWPDSRDRTTDHDILEIAKQMERLVVHMLALTRSEQSQLTVKFEEISVSELLVNIWNKYSERASERGLKVTMMLAPTYAQADQFLLSSILSNLCENAVEYAPRDGDIQLTTRVENQSFAIEISNSAPELTSKDIEKLFDRFWRKEAARTGGNHTGLGLSMARSFAQTMGWSLEAKLKESQLILSLSGRLLK
jgi:two-component system sensor histidine kinase QseC